MADGGKNGSSKDGALTSIEDMLKGVWCELLQVDEVAPTDDFFRLGGNSLTAVMMLKVLQDEHGMSLPLKALYLNPTIKGIVAAATIEGEI